jgi:hypothetical protein
MNDASLFVRLVFRFLGAHHPIRLTLGIAIGVLLKMAVGAMAAAYEHPSLTYLGTWATYWYMLGCAPLMYATLLIGKRGAPETVVHQINTVDALLDRSGLSQESKKLVWRSLVTKYVEEAKPDLSQTPNLKQLAELELQSSPQGPTPAP